MSGAAPQVYPFSSIAGQHALLVDGSRSLKLNRSVGSKARGRIHLDAGLAKLAFEIQQKALIASLLGTA